MKIRIFFAWYDIWIGFYWNNLVKTLYICPIPMICIRISFLDWHLKRQRERENEQIRREG